MVLLEDESFRKRKRESLKFLSIGVSFWKHKGSFFSSAAAAAFAASWPVLPSVSTPSPDLLGTGKIGINSARSSTTWAWSPVHAVDLPETNIIRSIGVMELGMRVTATLSSCNTLAASLAPAWIASASSSNINGRHSGKLCKCLRGSYHRRCYQLKRMQYQLQSE